MLKVKELLEATNGKLLNGNLDDEINNYKIDSREVKSGDFYIPIVGENVDGHRFINDTVKNNCSGFFVSDIDSIDIQKIKEVNKDIIIIEVEDTLIALHSIGEYNRDIHISIPIVAVTGSVGKTSTREIISSVLSVEPSLTITIS